MPDGVNLLAAAFTQMSVIVTDLTTVGFGAEEWSCWAGVS